ncbi:polysaccharide pyruvyl transferase family protein [Prosthecomicrobium sp. N25]|uniref:polysaccharide pyruvyl transferase family protein n=1 Tax=Prosthecomicrobium sp. N25 TaxID=3129254 RepID=UPI0030772A1A
MKTKTALITRLSTQNAGNEALSTELIRMFRQKPDLETRVLDRYPRKLETRSFAEFGPDLSEAVPTFERLTEAELPRERPVSNPSLAPLADESLVALDTSGKELPGWVRSVKRRIGVRRNLAALGLIGREEANTTLDTLNWADLVIWNPAGEFHPTGDPDQNLRILMLMRAAQRAGKRTAIINHSLEIEEPRLRAVVSHVYRHCDFLAVREEPSADAVRALGVTPNRIQVVPDIVFRVSREPGPLPAGAIVPEGAIGFSINGLEAESGLDEWDALFSALKATGRPFVFVSNAANHDLAFAERMALRYDGKVVGWQPKYRDLQSIMSRLAVLVSSRLHSSILAMSAGTPVVTVEPSVHKLTGIMQEIRYPLATRRSTDPGWSERVVADVSQILADRPRYAALCAAIVDEQARRIDDLYDKALQAMMQPC